MVGMSEHQHRCLLPVTQRVALGGVLCRCRSFLKPEPEIFYTHAFNQKSCVRTAPLSLHQSGTFFYSYLATNFILCFGEDEKAAET
jgi:hypothetical protein